MKKVVKSLALGFVAAGLVFTGCTADVADNVSGLAAIAASSGSSGTVVSTKVSSANIKFTNTEDSIVSGSTVKLKVNITVDGEEVDVDEALDNEELEFSIADSDDGVTKAKISNRKLTVEGKGEVVVKAKYRNSTMTKAATAKFTFTVEQAAEDILESITLTPTGSMVKVNESITVSAKAKYSVSGEKDISEFTLTASDTSKVSISGTTIKGLAKTDAVTITGTYNGKTDSFSLKVTEIDVILTKIEATQSATALTIDESTANFTVKATYSDGSTSADYKSFNVSTSGNVSVSGTTVTPTGTTAGNATVTVTSTENTSLSSTMTFTLALPATKTLALTADKTSLKANETATITAKYNGGAANNVTYTSSNTSVATVDSNGVVTAKSVASSTNVTISASYTDKYGRVIPASVIFTVNPQDVVVHTISFTQNLATSAQNSSSVTLTVAASCSQGDQITYTWYRGTTVVGSGASYTATSTGEYKCVATCAHGDTATSNICDVKIDSGLGNGGINIQF